MDLGEPPKLPYMAMPEPLALPVPILEVPDAHVPSYKRAFPSRIVPFSVIGIGGRKHPIFGRTTAPIAGTPAYGIVVPNV